MSAIQREIKQSKPFASKAAEGLVALLRTTDVLRRLLAEVVEARKEGLPTLEIGERMIEQSPGVTRLLDRLEAKALVRRERCPRDRRQVTCRIGPDGLAVLANLEKPLARAQGALLGHLGDARTGELIHLLDQLRAAARAAVSDRRIRPVKFRPVK